MPKLLIIFEAEFQGPLAGLISSSAGLLTTVILNIYIMTMGKFDIEEETYIVQWFGIDFIQEFVMYITVPISFIGFFIGYLLDKRIKP